MAGDRRREQARCDHGRQGAQQGAQQGLRRARQPVREDLVRRALPRLARGGIGRIARQNGTQDGVEGGDVAFVDHRGRRHGEMLREPGLIEFARTAGAAGRRDVWKPR
jgi:hypothetical protein